MIKRNLMLVLAVLVVTANANEETDAIAPTRESPESEFVDPLTEVPTVQTLIVRPVDLSIHTYAKPMVFTIHSSDTLTGVPQTVVEMLQETHPNSIFADFVQVKKHTYELMWFIGDSLPHIQPAPISDTLHQPPSVAQGYTCVRHVRLPVDAHIELHNSSMCITLDGQSINGIINGIFAHLFSARHRDPDADRDSLTSQHRVRWSVHTMRDFREILNTTPQEINTVVRELEVTSAYVIDGILCHHALGLVGFIEINFSNRNAEEWLDYLTVLLDERQDMPLATLLRLLFANEAADPFSS